MWLACFINHESFEGRNQIILILYLKCPAHDRSSINIFKKKGRPQKKKEERKRGREGEKEGKKKEETQSIVDKHRSFMQIKGNLRQKYLSFIY